MEKKEFIGYRPNGVPVGSTDSKIVTVFAERNNDRALGEYGGDAYPFTYEIENDRKIYGISVVADGVGNGGYEHPSLEKNLEKYISKNYPEPSEDKKDATMLYTFLTILYGEEFVKDKEALDYALKSFGYVPTAGFFAKNEAEKETDWNSFDQEKPTEDRKGQKYIPFWRRDSQSLGSRIVCVGLFYKFRKYFVDSGKNCIDKQLAEELRDEIEKYLKKLKKNIQELFSYDDAPNTTKRKYYFLCSTLAVWFYIADGKNVSALSLNCGDARCYIVDTKEGVRQISIDDAFSDGTMSAFIHYGEEQRNNDGYHDGQLHARIVNLEYPCALFACSDGIYDTCPSTKGISVSEDINEEPNANDFLFELNMLKALRNCYSLEDFRREVVFNFYAQADTRCAELRESGNYQQIKRDDSGTLAGRFFADSAIQLFDALRNEKEIFLDQLIELLRNQNNKGNFIPYFTPKVSSSDQKQKDFFGYYAQDIFRDKVSNLLLSSYAENFDKMKKIGESKLWGIDGCIEKEKLSGLKLRKLLFTRSNLEIMLKGAIDNIDEDNSVKPKWDNVLCVTGVKEALEKTEASEKKDISISEFIDQYNKLSKKGDDDSKIEMYNKFIECLFGSIPDNYDVDIVKERTLKSLQEND